MSTTSTLVWVVKVTETFTFASTVAAPVTPDTDVPAAILGEPEIGEPDVGADPLNAIEKDGLIWTTHGSDLKGWETPLTSLYGFESIPHTVLVNQNGMIVGKGLRGELLINKIKSLF